MHKYLKRIKEQVNENKRIAVRKECAVFNRIIGNIPEKSFQLYIDMMKVLLAEKETNGSYSNFISQYSLGSISKEAEDEFGYNPTIELVMLINLSLMLKSDIQQTLNIIKERRSHIKEWNYDIDSRYRFEIISSNGEFRYSAVEDVLNIEQILKSVKLNGAESECHNVSFLLARNFPKKCVAATGIIKGEWEGQENYHSWIEIEENDVVIDASRNIFMPREDYYRLFVNSNKPINRIPQEELKALQKSGIDSVAYLIYKYMEKEDMIKLDDNNRRKH